MRDLNVAIAGPRVYASEAIPSRPIAMPTVGRVGSRTLQVL
jgi:hypothetical protein